MKAASLFFNHLIPPSTYHSVIAAVPRQAVDTATQQLHELLFFSVCQVVLTELTPTEQIEFVKRVTTSDQHLLDWLETVVPEARALLVQTLDRTLLAVASAIH